MKKIVFTVVALGALPLPSYAQSARSDIAAPTQRQAVLARGEAVLNARGELAATIPADSINPFNPRVVVPDAPAPVRAPRGARELIALLAAQLNPTGSAERDGEKFLLLGQRKVKLGERFPIAFENGQYEVELASVDGGTFTLKYNNELFTRPIKPGKNP